MTQFETLDCRATMPDGRNDTTEITPDEAVRRSGLPAGQGQLAVVAMSGGVDSAVSALLLREAGFRAVGINMRLFTPEEGHSRCCSIDDMEDARAVCRALDIPFYPLNMEREFAGAVIEPFIDAYLAGRTPNPCLECNRKPKFAFLLGRARALGAAYLATGHYARVTHDEAGHSQLRRAVDERKDQSYVLYTFTQEQLRRVLFPVGGLTKAEVRGLARRYALPVARKAESQDICFVPDGDYASFVLRRRPGAARPGPIVNQAGEVLGQHRGLIHYTVGQRKGLGVSGPAPLYVLALDTARNRLVVGAREELGVTSLLAERVNYLAGAPPAEPLEVLAVVRYRGQELPAILTPHGDGRARLTFATPPPAAAPGQAVVFYDPHDRTLVLGGGTIAATERRGLPDAMRPVRQLPVVCG